MPPPAPTLTPPPRRLLHAAVGLAATACLGWAALPYLPGQIDDSYIVFAYAHRIVEHGEIAWNTGERVEGYSSPLHLLLMVAGCLAGMDLSVFARVVSFAAAAATLALLLRRQMGDGRAWLALGLAAWQPFQLWSVAALETSLATLIAAAGWPLIFAGRSAWAVGCGLLCALSLTRPEGAAWLAAGLALRVRYPAAFGRPEGAVAAILVALASYHAARVAYFGALMPTPWLVKIVAIESFAGGAKEVGWELLSASPLIALAVILRRSVPVWVWFPLALQSALLIRAGGDWMGHARLVLPGVVASLSAALVGGQTRPIPAWSPALLLPFVALAFAAEPAQMQGAGPRWRDPWYLGRPAQALAAPWSVPLLEEVSFLIRRVPEGAGAQLSDVGLPGNLEGVRVWDGAGLTDRVVAEIIAGSDPQMSRPLKARFDDPDDVWCLRYGLADDGTDPADPWLKTAFPELATQPDARGLFWRCRPGGTVSDATVAMRWQRLLERFPAQDEIRLRYARALLAVGDIDGALASAREAMWIGADSDGWVVFDAQTTAAYQPGRGWPLYANGSLRSAVLPADFWDDHRLALDVDDPGAEGAATSLSWDPPCGDPVRLNVAEIATVRPPTCLDQGPRALVVAFLNDESRAGFDRNLFVTLRAAGPTPGP